MSMPTVFVSHGSPMLYLEKDLPARGFLAGLGSAVPKPTTILAVSAHWNTERPEVSLTARPETIHDFYGFPDALYKLHYDAPGAPALARARGGDDRRRSPPNTVSTTAPGCRRCWAGPMPISRSSSSRYSPT